MRPAVFRQSRNLIFSATLVSAYRAHATGMMSLRPSVCSSVLLLVDCDHTTQCNKKWKWAHDRIGRCLGYLRAIADQDSNVLESRMLQWKTRGSGSKLVSVYKLDRSDYMRGCYRYPSVD